MKAIVLTDNEIKRIKDFKEVELLIEIITKRIRSYTSQAIQASRCHSVFGEDAFVESYDKFCDQLLKRLEGEQHALLQALSDLEDEKREVKKILKHACEYDCNGFCVICKADGNA